MRDVAGLAADRLWWEYDSRADIGVGQALQEVGPAAFGDACLSIHHEILLQAQRVLAMTEHGERHTRLALHVLDFLPDTHVRTDEFVVLDTDPDDCHLRAAVRVIVVRWASGPLAIRSRTDAGMIIAPPHGCHDCCCIIAYRAGKERPRHTLTVSITLYDSVLNCAA